MTTTVSLGERALLVAVDGADGDDLIAVDEATLGIDGEHPVGVTVEGQPEVGAVRQDRRLQVLGVGGAAVLVDVDAVGLDVDRHDDRAERLEHPGRQLRRGTVGAVEHDLETIERTGGNDVLDEVLAVPADRGVVEFDRADLGACRARTGIALGAQGGELEFQPLLDLIGQLGAAGREQLDAVVAEGVVRRRDHGGRHLVVRPRGRPPRGSARRRGR